MYGERIEVLEGALDRGVLQSLHGVHHRGFVAEGQRLRIRSQASLVGAPTLALVSTLRGAAVMGQDGHSWRVEPGTLVLIRADRPSWLASDGPFKQVGLLVSHSHLLGPRAVVLGAWPAHTSPVSRLLLDAMRGLGEASDGLEVDAIGRALVGLLRDAALTFSADDLTRPSVRVSRALRQIEEQYPDPLLSPDRVAAEQGVSRRWLDQALRSTGTTLAAAILDRRLTAAKELFVARPDLQVVDVAVMCGFTSLSAFSHTFRRQVGMSPTEWAKRRQVDEVVGQDLAAVWGAPITTSSSPSPSKSPVATAWPPRSPPSAIPSTPDTSWSYRVYESEIHADRRAVKDLKGPARLARLGERIGLVPGDADQKLVVAVPVQVPGRDGLAETAAGLQVRPAALEELSVAYKSRGEVPVHGGPGRHVAEGGVCSPARQRNVVAVDRGGVPSFDARRGLPCRLGDGWPGASTPIRSVGQAVEPPAHEPTELFLTVPSPRPAQPVTRRPSLPTTAVE
jgi:AraC-like DNA-binding protein